MEWLWRGFCQPRLRLGARPAAAPYCTCWASGSGGKTSNDVNGPMGPPTEQWESVPGVRAS
jgi:hypothetical protein